MKRDYLIVGQGIAGSVLAWHLMKAGYSVHIVDQSHHESSSMISAGIINPITGQRLALTPRFNLFITQAINTYSQMGAELGMNFFIPKPIIRILRSNEELDRSHHLQSDLTAQSYIVSIHKPGYYGSSVNDPFGTLTIAQGGYLQTQTLLKTLKEYFLNHKMLTQEYLSYEDLIVSDHVVKWKSQEFNVVIFCEGFKAKQNPWFKHLAYNFAKGEILRVAFESVLPDAILCQQQWCLPTLDGTYLAGSTYDRTNINTVATKEGKESILQGLSHFISLKPRVIETYAAVRPVMLDPKPVMGMHPSYPRLGIFNGFASKGILWTPTYAQQLIKLLHSNGISS